MTTDAARAAAEDYARTPRMNVGTVRDRIAEAHLDGSAWGREQALAQEPTDAEVDAARTEVREALRDQYKDRYNLGRYDSINIGDEIDIDETAEIVARAALTAARKFRRDEETR